MWKLSWFLRDFGYDTELLGKNEIEDRALVDLWGVVKVSEVNSARHLGPQLRWFCAGRSMGRAFSFYRHLILVALGWLRDLQLYPDLSVFVLPATLQASLSRWLEGKRRWAAMLFGRAFEQAVAAYFQRQDAAAVLYREWVAHRDSGPLYSEERDSWDRMLQSGVQLLDRFAQDDRIRIHQPEHNSQVKFTRQLVGQNDHFVRRMPREAASSAYSTTLAYFAESCREAIRRGIDRKDMLNFQLFYATTKISHLGAAGTSLRTSWHF